MNPELKRLADDRAGVANWRRWGPYLSERHWGTVREDYSADGAAWDYFPHDHARSRVYRWGEDGLAGFSDDKQFVCLSLALWNGKDPILKERLFGLINSQGNHGEDVKELYYYLDGVPSQSYLKMLYKYPQLAYPYEQLIEENRTRGLSQPEYELLDSGLFDQDMYFDVFVEYAKRAPDDVLMRVTVHNRGDTTAPISVIPQITFRNTWSWSGMIRSHSFRREVQTNHRLISSTLSLEITSSNITENPSFSSPKTRRIQRNALDQIHRQTRFSKMHSTSMSLTGRRTL